MDWLYKRVSHFNIKKTTAAKINKILLDSFQADTMEYRSINSVL